MLVVFSYLVLLLMLIYTLGQYLGFYKSGRFLEDTISGQRPGL